LLPHFPRLQYQDTVYDSLSRLGPLVGDPCDWCPRDRRQDKKFFPSNLMTSFAVQANVASSSVELRSFNVFPELFDPRAFFLSQM
jgi:hypothetical protein